MAVTSFERALFLDFDGVLHPAGAPPGSSLPFCWVPHLAEDLDPFTDVGLVIHSSWIESPLAANIPEFIAPLESRLIGVVERGPKSEAILRFARRHFETSKWLVVDDDASQFPSNFPGALLLCDPLTGLADQRTRRLLQKWLTSGWSTMHSAMEPV